MKSEFVGSIATVRDVEDSIRATRRYTKGVFSKPAAHPSPIQGSDFPSRVLTEYYEVYPDTDVHWDMPAGVALDWLWGDVTHIDVLFFYDYRVNKAKVVVRGGAEAVEELTKGIPRFGDTLAKVVAGAHEEAETKRVVDDSRRLGHRAITNP